MLFDIVRGKMLTILLALVLIFPIVAPAQAETAVASFIVGQAVWAGSGHQSPMDVAPFISNGRVYVPIRYLAQGLGAASTWNPGSQTVTLSNGSTTIILTIGGTEETVNGTPQSMDVAPMIVDGRTMLPARWVAEAFGDTVDWVPQSQQVIVWPATVAPTTPSTPTVTENQVPAAPTGMQETSIAPGDSNNDYNITFTWNPVSGAVAYNLYTLWSGSNTGYFLYLRDIQNDYVTANFSNFGTHTVYVTAVNSAGESKPSNIVQVYFTSSGQSTPSTSPLTLSNTTLPICTIGQPYSYTISASGGVPPYTYQITDGSLPDGISLSANGTISGTATMPWVGSWNFTVTVTDSTGATASNTFQFPAYTNQTPSTTSTSGSSTQQVITLNPLDTNSWEVNNYSWTYQGQQFTWQIGVPQSLIEHEAFVQVPQFFKEKSLWQELFGPQPTSESVSIGNGNTIVLGNLPYHIDDMISDTASFSYINQVAVDLDQVAKSQGYDYFHEAEFIAAFVQSIPYKIINNNTEYPPQVIANGGDCINKSLLLAAILDSMRTPGSPNEAVIVIPQAGHAVAGIGLLPSQIPADRTGLTYYTYQGENFYFTESTEPGWQIGQNSLTNLGASPSAPVVIYPILSI